MDNLTTKQKEYCTTAIKTLLSAETDIVNAIKTKFSNGWPEFDDALTLMQSISKSNRVIITGMGKSGHVGAKIAATMSSLGKPAHFVHPGEASHGDLGMVVRGDVLLVLSNSGNTGELDAILQYAQQIEVPIIGITMGVNSKLTKAATVPLIIPKANEGCSLGLAPTTSTVAQLAIGDALSVGIAVINDFDRDMFNTLHPGGSLGASTTKVSDGMVPADRMVIARPDTPLNQVILDMANKSLSVAAIIDDAGFMVGIVRAKELTSAQHTASMTASHAMRTPEPVVYLDDSMATAFSRSRKNATDAIVVVKDRKPVGVVRTQ